MVGIFLLKKPSVKRPDKKPLSPQMTAKAKLYNERKTPNKTHTTCALCPTRGLNSMTRCEPHEADSLPLDSVYLHTCSQAPIGP